MRTYNKDPGASLKGLPLQNLDNLSLKKKIMTVKEYNPLDEIIIHIDININEEQNTQVESQ